MTKIKFVSFIFLIVLFSCSKKNTDEVTPQEEALTEAKLMGTWNLESVNGSVTIDGKTEKFTDNAHDYAVMSDSTYTFKTGGIVSSTYGDYKFTLKDDVLLLDMTDEYSELKVPVKAKLVNSKLVLTADKTSYAALIILYQAFGAGKITAWDEVATYKKK